MLDKDLENKAWFKASKDLELICKPLFTQTPLANVVYQKMRVS